MSHRIDIDEMRLCCLVHEEVARSGREPEVLDRVLSSASSTVPRFLQSALAAEPDSDSVLFIDTLGFDATVNAAWSAEAIGKAVAVQLLRRLWSLDESQVVRFRDRTEVYAAFLLHLANGSAYTQSWHELMFGGLKPLSASAIVRTLIVEDVPRLRAALARLSAADLKKVANGLVGFDAASAVDAMTAHGGSAPCRDPYAIAEAVVAQQCFQLARPSQRLELVIALFREGAVEADGFTLALAFALSHLAAEGLVPGADSEAQALDTLVARFAKSLSLDVREADIAQRVAALDTNATQEAVALLRPHLCKAADELYCDFAGAWLLLPHVLEVLGDSGLSVPESERAHLALQALALSAGPKATSVLSDPLLRAALMLPGLRSADDADEACDDADQQEDAPEACESEQRDPLPANAKRFRLAQAQAASHVAAGGSAETIPPRPRNAHTASFAARRRDVRYLRAAAGSVGLCGCERWIAVRVAYAAVRAYGRRLPGFAQSSLAHLWANFLGTAATIVRSERHLDVRLDPPALDVIWRISGADRAGYALPGGYTVKAGVRR